MMLSRACGAALLYTVGSLSVLAAAPGDTGNPFQVMAKPNGDRMDRSWKRYRNPELGYCVSYPSRWSRGPAFEGSGILIETGLRRYSKPSGEIDIGPMDAETSEDARMKRVNFSDDLTQQVQEHLSGLQKFARAERMEIIEQHSMDVQGFKGLYMKNQYYDPLERKHWMEEVVFVRHTTGVYRLELQCPPEQIKRFGPVFAYLVNSLEFGCK